MTGHDLQSWEETRIEKFSGELTGAPLNPEQVRLAKIKEVEFLHTFFQSTRKSLNPMPMARSLSRRGGSRRSREMQKRPDVLARSVSREFKWKSPEIKHIRCNASVGITEVHFVTAPNAQEGPVTVATGRGREGGREGGREENSFLGRITRAFPSQGSTRAAHTAAGRHVRKVVRTLYGTRDASNARDEFFKTAGIEQGFEIGLSSPCLCFYRAQDSHGWIH